MRTVNMHEAKTHLSRLVRDAANGEPFIIARAGKPVVKVISVEAPDPGTGAAHRIGFLDGQITVPDDFDHMGSAEIKKLFEGDQ
ncbi:MAG: type II toxin-antitoxin system prevent-host-death family antitoxin [Gemmatimonadetes bacterium]|nr:type II toxin-antitoxin system prevent-host-death family antitoxin [Gemmatimonadota bacterium]